MFYTMSESVETKAVIEVIIIEVDTKKRTKKPHGVGYAVAPLFYDELPVTIEIYKGSPREVIKNAGDPGYQPPMTGSIIYYDVKQQPPKKFDPLMNLIPDNIVIGQNDDIPGLVDSKLPVKPDDITQKLSISPIKTIFAHNVRISSMNEVEAAF